MLKSQRQRQNEQFGLFHPPHRSPPWRTLPTQVKKKAVELLAQMLHQALVGQLHDDDARETPDD
jgi:hypothetical protein